MDGASLKLAAEPMPAPAPRSNRGWFGAGDRRINRDGRPRKPPPGVHPADCAAQADRVKRLVLPASELVWRFTGPNGFWLVNLPTDVEIVASRVDAATKRIIFILRSPTFPWIGRGAPIPDFEPVFNGLAWRFDKSWRPRGL